MQYCPCGKAASVQCSHHPTAVFCGNECTHVSSHPCFYATIDGKAKRDRSKSPPKRKNAPKKKPAKKKENDMWDVVLHTLRHTPEMLENLAKVMTLEQLRSLKFSGRGLYHSIWKNRQFWYYVVKRFRPEDVHGFYDQNIPYKEYAMRTFIAPDKTIMDPSVDDGFPPMLADILKIVMTNAAALDTLIRDVEIDTILGWARVSREFYRIVFKSNYFWYLMNSKYGNLRDVYRFNVDYYQKAQEELKDLFRVAITLNVPDEDVFTFQNRFINSKLDRNVVQLTHLDVKLCGGLRECLEMLDYDLNIPDDYQVEANYKVSDKKNSGDYETTTEDIPSFEDMMDEFEFSVSLMENTWFTLYFTLYVDYSQRHTLTIEVTFPKTLIPVREEDGQMVPQSFFPVMVTDNGDTYTVSTEYDFYGDEDFENDNVYDLMVENLPSEFRLRAPSVGALKDIRLATFHPGSLVHRGFIDRTLDLDSWETQMDDNEVTPGASIRFEAIAEMLANYSPQDDDTLTIQVRKKL